MTDLLPAEQVDRRAHIETVWRKIMGHRASTRLAASNVEWALLDAAEAAGYRRGIEEAAKEADDLEDYPGHYIAVAIRSLIQDSGEGEV